MFPKSHDHFIRVNFTDEDLMTYRYDREVDNEQYIYPRIRQLLVGK
jgi:RNA dependent RNA polymerase